MRTFLWSLFLEKESKNTHIVLRTGTRASKPWRLLVICFSFQNSTRAFSDVAGQWIDTREEMSSIKTVNTGIQLQIVLVTAGSHCAGDRGDKFIWCNKQLVEFKIKISMKIKLVGQIYIFFSIFLKIFWNFIWIIQESWFQIFCKQ